MKAIYSHTHYWLGTDKDKQILVVRQGDIIPTLPHKNSRDTHRLKIELNLVFTIFYF